jgi:hypothetical protein
MAIVVSTQFLPAQEDPLKFQQIAVAWLFSALDAWVEKTHD